MTVPVGSPQQKFREDTVMPMEVLSLYADPIGPALAGGVFAPEQGCRVFMHPAGVLGQFTHCVSWNLPELPSRQLRKVPGGLPDVPEERLRGRDRHGGFRRHRL